MDEPQEIGDWIRERVLGCGTFGTVTLWRNKKNDKRIAIKKCRVANENELTEKHKVRWTQEVDMMKKIKNQNIVSFHPLPEDLERELLKYNTSNLPMLSMEYCGRGDLRSLLSRTLHCCGLLETEVRYILSDLMNAVSHLHSLKITHRDLKPENIVLQTCDRPNGIMYKLIDLGYAKEIDAKSVCASFVGTLQYLAPELLYSKTYSCSVDYWSMGLVAFEIICGVRPFLPHLTPADWMFHVHKKSSDIICIYEDRDTSIVNSTEIFPENHISSCLKHEIEKWLQIALEYQPRKRGYLNYDQNKDNELVIFTSLRKLLDKKIITVFVVYSCKKYSYEIDSCTQVSTLQGWIARDTKIPVPEQILVSECCEHIELNGLATQFFDDTYKYLLYVFKKEEILMNTVIPDVPELVRFVLENRQESLPQHYRKRIYSQIMYFIATQTRIYDAVLDACSLLLKRMCNSINRMCCTMNVEMEKFEAMNTYHKEILDFDLKQYQKNYSQHASHWSKPFNDILQNLKTMNDARGYINLKQEATCRKIAQLASQFDKMFAKYSDHELNLILDDAVRCYNDVRDSIKSRSQCHDNQKRLQKILYDVLKVRDKMLQDTTFRNFLRIIAETQKDVDRMQKPVQNTISHVQGLRKDLITHHLARQNKIWEFTIKQKPKYKTAEVNSLTDVANFKITSTEKSNFQNDIPLEKQADSEPIKLVKPVEFHLGPIEAPKETASQLPIPKSSPLPDPCPAPVNNDYENVCFPSAASTDSLAERTSTLDLIRHNMDLRHEIQEKTNESFIKCRSIMSEVLDFSFLNEPF